jgi:phosphoglycerate dehydrogenase-like enzyme
MRISVPNEHMLDRLSDVDADLVVWDWEGPPPDGPTLDLAIRPYTLSGGLEHLAADRVQVVQTQSLGYDDAIGTVPEGIVWCNAVGVHEGPTAEIAVALTLASLRGVDENARAMPDGRWERHWHPGLLGSRVLLLGYGGIGTEVEKRLDGFGVEIVRVARTARGDIHGTDELPALLGIVDVVIVAVPYGPATHHLVDDAFLTAMKDGALLVNVARGKVADTDAVVRHAGRIRFAADVVDPEPLPPDHPLWTAPGVLLTPHVGGAVTTMHDRVEAMVREQIRRLQAGEPLLNVVDVSG